VSDERGAGVCCPWSAPLRCVALAVGTVGSTCVGATSIPLGVGPMNSVLFRENRAAPGMLTDYPPLNENEVRKAEHPDFDSAVPRFESWHPSQPPLSLAGELRHSTKSRHFWRLGARSSVSCEKIRAARASGLKSGERSLLVQFPISEFFISARPEIGCISAETGSKIWRFAWHSRLARMARRISHLGAPTRTLTWLTCSAILDQCERPWTRQEPPLNEQRGDGASAWAKD
jgi:hypothetical protein